MSGFSRTRDAFGESTLAPERVEAPALDERERIGALIGWAIDKAR